MIPKEALIELLEHKVVDIFDISQMVDLSKLEELSVFELSDFLRCLLNLPTDNLKLYQARVLLISSFADPREFMQINEQILDEVANMTEVQARSLSGYIKYNLPKHD